MMNLKFWLQVNVCGSLYLGPLDSAAFQFNIPNDIEATIYNVTGWSVSRSGKTGVIKLRVMCIYLSHATRKPVFGDCDQVRLKPSCSGSGIRIAYWWNAETTIIHQDLWLGN